MTPKKLSRALSQLARHRESSSLMIWGPPGVGKSSLVAQVAEEQELELVDVRLSQLAPTDLRGLPVAEQGVSTWYPPEFLPRCGRGILFLDELNMATPAVQGVAQQLVLDRKVGNYTVPEGWMIWAAGNRREDQASVFQMPAPLANRFLHFTVEPSLKDFREYGRKVGLHERLLAFLAFRPELLHRLDAQQPAWPSPRTWELAHRLLQADLPVHAAVGDAAAGEFEAFVQVYASLPNWQKILAGIPGEAFPENPGARFALITSLAHHCQTVEQAVNTAVWLTENAPHEWGQLFFKELMPALRQQQLTAAFSRKFLATPELRGFLKEFKNLMEAA